MKEIGAALLVRTIAGLVNGTLKEIPQISVIREPALPGPTVIDPSPLKHAPKIFTETCLIDWNQPMEKVYNLIRGLSPFPASYTHLDGKMLKIFRSEKESKAPTVAAGSHETDGRTFFRFAAADGYIRVTELQLEGKKKMKVEEFLRGYRPNTQPPH